MRTRAQLKEAAKGDIRGNILMYFLCSLIVVLLILVSLLLPFVVIFVGPPLSISLTGISLDMAKHTKRTEISDIFKYFGSGRLLSSVGLVICKILLLWAWSVVPMVVGGLLCFLLVITQTPTGVVVGIIFAVAGGVAGSILGLIKGYAYSMAEFVWCDDETITCVEAIRISKELTDGHKFEIFVLWLSFILWVLLLSITFSISGIYSTPYMNVTFAEYYLDLKRMRGTPQIVSSQQPQNIPDHTSAAAQQNDMSAAKLSGKYATLMCVRGEADGKRVKLFEGDKIYIGRDPSCIVCYGSNAHGISRVHCSVEYIGGKVYIRDENSSYGTYIANNVRVNPGQRIELTNGMGFYLVNNENLFVINFQG